MRRHVQRGHPRRGRWAFALPVLATVALAGTVAGTGQATEPAGSPSVGSVSGTAYGARASLTRPDSPKLYLGRVAQQGLPCAPDSDMTRTNQAAFARLAGSPSGTPKLVDTGTIVNRGTVDISDPGASPAFTDVLETSTVEQVSLLDGRIKATLVKAQAHATLDDAHPILPFTHESGKGTTPPHQPLGNVPTGARFVDLVIDEGTPSERRFAGTPPANTTIPLGSVGKVVLNEIVYEGSKTIVRNIAVRVLIENLGGYKGEIIVGLARAGVAPQPAGLQASAFGLTSKTGNIVDVGRQNLLTLPCGGGSRIQSAVGFDGGPIPLLSDTMRSTVDGGTVDGITSTRAIAELESLRIGSVNPSTGARLLTADLVVGRSNVFELPTGGVQANGNGTEIRNLFINGSSVPIGPGTPQANTVIELGDPNDPSRTLGRVTLNRQLCYTSAADPRGFPFKPTASNPCTATHGARLVTTALVLEILHPNDHGLPVGTQVRVSEAISSVRLG